MARILVADDEAGLREFITDTLELDDHAVVAARDGRPYLQPQADRAASVAAGCEIWSPRWQRGAFEAVPAVIERALNA